MNGGGSGSGHDRWNAVNGRCWLIEADIAEHQANMRAKRPCGDSIADGTRVHGRRHRGEERQRDSIRESIAIG